MENNILTIKQFLQMMADAYHKQTLEFFILESESKKLGSCTIEKIACSAKIITRLKNEMKIIYTEQVNYSKKGDEINKTGRIPSGFKFVGFNVAGINGEILSRYALSAYMTKKYASVDYDVIMRWLKNEYNS